jgi:hypothetical protein
MKKFKILALLSGALLMGGACAAACTNIPLVFSLSFTYVDGMTRAALYSDGTASYVDRVDGVTAVLDVCGTNPTHDAILIVANSKRSIGIDLTRPVATNTLTPDWTRTPFLSQGVLKVRNILFNPNGPYDPNASYSFTTGAGYDFQLPNPPKSTWYHVRMQNPADQAVGPKSTDSIVNTPLNTSLVIVQHTPANPTTGAPETWTAYPDATIMDRANATQVGTLLQENINLGQFTVPFVITITKK